MGYGATLLGQFFPEVAYDFYPLSNLNVGRTSEENKVGAICLHLWHGSVSCDIMLANRPINMSRSHVIEEKTSPSGRWDLGLDSVLADHINRGIYLQDSSHKFYELVDE